MTTLHLSANSTTNGDVITTSISLFSATPPLCGLLTHALDSARSSLPTML